MPRTGKDVQSILVRTLNLGRRDMALPRQTIRRGQRWSRELSAGDEIESAAYLAEVFDLIEARYGCDVLVIHLITYFHYPSRFPEKALDMMVDLAFYLSYYLLDGEM
jgi:hypothetical protein